jgi:PQQ-dependent dehydrogenase (s-GDH family)
VFRLYLLQHMKHPIAALLVFLLLQVAADAQTTTASFKQRVIIQGLEDPWEIVYGPDQQLWITEAKGYRVSRIDPATGRKQVLLDVSSDRYFGQPGQQKNNWPQGGLMGLALHPALAGNKPYVYIAYHFAFEGCRNNDSGCYYKVKLVRFTYNKQQDTLHSPLVICDTIPASNDHNGGRLLCTTEQGKSYLYYTVGDMGAGQYNNAARPNHAQDLRFYEGKILRFLAEPEERQGKTNWIPASNPFNTQAIRSAVFSIGHRNPQGICALQQNGKTILFSSEHGPFSDDEINVIEAGGNYGHPLVIGYADGNYNGLAAGVSSNMKTAGQWHSSYPGIQEEQKNAAAIKNFHPPVRSLYPTPNDTIRQIMERKRSDTDPQPEWRSEAPSGIALYTQSFIPGWKNSLLVTSLKNGHLIRLAVEGQNPFVSGDPQYLFPTASRYRSATTDATGQTIYVCTDKSNVTSGPTREDPQQTGCKGCIIAFRYDP